MELDTAMSIEASSQAHPDRVPAAQKEARPRQRLRRRLPVERLWPTWAIVLVQLGLLTGFVAAWEQAAQWRLIDPFFWSRPSAIWSMLIIFFVEGNALVDIAYTFRSTLLGFALGTTAGALLVLFIGVVRRRLNRRSEPDRV